MIYEAKDENVIKAANLLLNGEVIVYPTDTLYGFGVDATNEDAINKLNKLKNRIQPLSIIVDSHQMLFNFCNLNEKNKDDLKKYFPGPFTLLMNKKNNLPDILTIGSKKIGVRIPDFRFPRNLVKYLNKPIVTTSVNIHNEKSLNNLNDINIRFPNINIFSGSVNRNSKGSTIIDITTNPYSTLREGDGIENSN